MKIRSELQLRASMLGALLVAFFATLPPAVATELEAADMAPLVASVHVEAPLPASIEPETLDAALLQETPDIVVEVNGLSCPFCAYGVEKKFVERPEVASIVVALEENEVHLWLKSGDELSDEAVRRTVDEAGFTPGEIRRPEPNSTRNQ